MNFYYLLVICAFCYYVLLLIRDLQILQQNVYNENQRYLKWIVRHKSQVFSFSLFLSVVLARLPFVLMEKSPAV